MTKVSQSRDIALFLEKLRAFRNISQEDFLFDIVSIRQYKRYTAGVSEMPYSILDKLCKKLGFNSEYIIMEMESEKAKETQKINNLYNAVISNNITTANQLFLEIDERHILSDNNKLLFEHTKNWHEYQLNHATQLVTINKTKKLVDYEKVLKKNALSTSELLILVSLLQLDRFKELDVVAQKLASYIQNQTVIVSGHNVRTVVLVLEELSKYFSIIQKIDKMLYYANEAIKYSISMRSFYLLDKLYYYIAFAYDKLGQYELRDDAIYKCLYILLIEENSSKINKYRTIFKDTFDIDLFRFAKLNKFNSLK